MSLTVTQPPASATPAPDAGGPPGPWEVYAVRPDVLGRVGVRFAPVGPPELAGAWGPAAGQGGAGRSRPGAAAATAGRGGGGAAAGGPRGGRGALRGAARVRAGAAAGLPSKWGGGGSRWTARRGGARG